MGWVAGATHPSIATNQPAKQAKNQEQTNNCSWEKKIFWRTPWERLTNKEGNLDSTMENFTYMEFSTRAEDKFKFFI